MQSKAQASQALYCTHDTKSCLPIQRLGWLQQWEDVRVAAPNGVQVTRTCSANLQVQGLRSPASSA